MLFSILVLLAFACFILLTLAEDYVMLSRCNAIAEILCGLDPVFVDVDTDSRIPIALQIDQYVDQEYPDYSGCWRLVRYHYPDDGRQYVADTMDELNTYA
jgi:hypothetical protein